MGHVCIAEFGTTNKQLAEQFGALLACLLMPFIEMTSKLVVKTNQELSILEQTSICKPNFHFQSTIVVVGIVLNCCLVEFVESDASRRSRFVIGNYLLKIA